MCKDCTNSVQQSHKRHVKNNTQPPLPPNYKHKIQALHTVSIDEEEKHNHSLPFPAHVHLWSAVAVYQPQMMATAQSPGDRTKTWKFPSQLSHAILTKRVLSFIYLDICWVPHLEMSPTCFTEAYIALFYASKQTHCAPVVCDSKSVSCAEEAI